MKDQHFIITGLQSWDIPIGSNAIDIAKEIAKNNRVLYVNTPLDIMTLIRNEKKPETEYRRKVLKGEAPELRQVSENLWVLDLPFYILSVNGLPDGILFDIVNKQNNRKIFKHINKCVKKLGFHDFVHLIDNDVYRSFYSKEFLKAKATVYYRRDNLHPFPYWEKHIGRLEPSLIKNVDLVVCNSCKLAEYAQHFNPKSFDIGQGVDLLSYTTKVEYSIPNELKTIEGPLIGYIGDINSLRLDVDLINQLALSCPQYNFIMVGPEDAVFKSHPIHETKNIHFIGRIEKNRVPMFINAMDVCINPQLVNEITIGNYPRKVDEYLAMGKPVVATKTSAMALFQNHTLLCETLSDYQQALKKAIRENTPTAKQERIEFAQSHSWQNNVEKIYIHLSNLFRNEL